MTNNIITFLAVLAHAVAAGFGISQWKNSGHSMRLLTILLVTGMINNFAMIWLAKLHINNLFLMHFHTLVSYCLLALLFAFWFRKKTAFVIRLSIPLFLITYMIFLILGIEDLSHPNKYSSVIESALTTLFFIGVLANILRTRATAVIYHNHRFWATIGIFIIYAGPVMLYAAIRDQITLKLWAVHNLQMTIGYLILLKAYFCIRREASKTGAHEPMP